MVRNIDLRTDGEKAEDLLYKSTRGTLAETLVKMEAEDAATCVYCSNPAGKGDPCPFSLSIDHETASCACCQSCRDACAADTLQCSGWLTI